jgi:sterol desaturase/sphingolipid hydroxylase (fatty acid hydroxylase superfamily)
MLLVETAISFALTYYIASTIQAVSHRLFGHTHRIKAVFESHALGHHGVYKIDSLVSDRWVSAERHVMWYFVLLFTPFFLAIYFFTSSHVFAGHILGLAFAVWWHVFLHKQYHIRGSYFERFAWFKKKRQLHLVHHRCVGRNYAIVEFWLDHVMGTMEKPNNTSQSTPANGRD